MRPEVEFVAIVAPEYVAAEILVASYSLLGYRRKSCRQLVNSPRALRIFADTCGHLAGAPDILRLPHTISADILGHGRAIPGVLLRSSTSPQEFCGEYLRIFAFCRPHSRTVPELSGRLWAFPDFFRHSGHPHKSPQGRQNNSRSGRIRQYPIAPLLSPRGTAHLRFSPSTRSAQNHQRPTRDGAPRRPIEHRWEAGPRPHTARGPARRLESNPIEGRPSFETAQCGRRRCGRRKDARTPAT